jgi:hypothetical protein
MCETPKFESINRPSKTIPFSKEEVKEYLDRAIKFWREKRDNEKSEMAIYYIDAFQSVRMSLFGELLK